MVSSLQKLQIGRHVGSHETPLNVHEVFEVLEIESGNENYTECPLSEVGARVGSMEEVKENRKILYHFAVFAIVG